MKNKSYENYKRTIEALRNVENEFFKCVEDVRCDKYGIGFNKHPDFSCYEIELRFDSWKGYYGNSSCSCFINLGDEELVTRYLLEYLNLHYQDIFTGVANLMEKEMIVKREEEISRLEKELEELKSINS